MILKQNFLLFDKMRKRSFLMIKYYFENSELKYFELIDYDVRCN